MTFSDDFSSYTLATTYADSASVGSLWTAVSNGSGTTSIVAAPDGGQALQLSPAVATSSGVTHSALVTSVASMSGNYRVQANYRTTAQLRTGSTPSNMEMAWLIWGYQDSTHFYTLVLRPNGWEIDKQVSTPALVTLASGVSPTFPVGATHFVDVHVTAAAGVPTFDIYVDGQLLTSVTDTGTTDPAILTGGIGLYAKDSSVDWEFAAGATPAFVASSVLDESLSGNSGTFTNTFHIGWTTAGQSGGGVLSDGATGQFVRVPRATALEPADAVTIMGWVNIPTVIPNTGKAMIAKGREAGTPSYALYARRYDGATAGLDLSTTANADFELDSGVNVMNSGWHHLAGTYDGTTAKIYVDGALENSAALTGQLVYDTNDLGLMGNAATGSSIESLFGTLDNVRVFAEALTIDEITAWMGTPVRSPAIYPDIVTPETNDTSASQATLGTPFASTVPGLVSAVYYWNGAAGFDNQMITVGIYDAATSTLIGLGARQQLTTDPTGWVRVPLSSPVSISANHNYVACYLTPAGGHYSLTDGYSPASPGALYLPGGSMPTVVGSVAESATHDVLAPADTAAGDLIITHMYVRDSGTTDPFSLSGLDPVPGWPIVGTAPSDAPHTMRHYAWYGYQEDAGAQSYFHSVGDYGFYGVALIAIHGGPTSGVPFTQSDLEALAPDATVNLPSCHLTTTAPNSLLLYLYTSRNDDGQSALSMTDTGHTWTAQGFDDIGTFSAPQASAGPTGTVHGSGVTTGPFAKTAALVAIPGTAAIGATHDPATVLTYPSSAGSTAYFVDVDFTPNS